MTSERVKNSHTNSRSPCYLVLYNGNTYSHHCSVSITSLLKHMVKEYNVLGPLEGYIATFGSSQVTVKLQNYSGTISMFPNGKQGFIQ